MKRLMSVFEILMKVVSFSYNIFSLKNAIAAVCINTIIGFILLLLIFFYPTSGWIGVITHFFFLYIGAMYVYVWDKLMNNPAISMASTEEKEETEEEKIEQ